MKAPDRLDLLKDKYKDSFPVLDWIIKIPDKDEYDRDWLLSRLESAIEMQEELPDEWLFFCEIVPLGKKIRITMEVVDEN